MDSQLTLASYNVQGLGRDHTGIRKRRKIRDFLRKSQPRPDVLLIQEHKLSPDEGSKHGNQMGFKNGASFWNEAIYYANKDSFKGGTAILISDKVTNIVREHGVIMGEERNLLLYNGPRE